MAGPLDGLKVFELCHIMAGPTCGMMLADMGANVIKVEKPSGDDTRRFLPPDVNGESAAYMMMNRNKRGIALDLKKPAARDALKTMLSDADVVIENFRRDTMERLGLSYEVLSAINPGLIYCEISGFGRTGPYADRGGFDLIAQGMSGLMSITGEGHGRPPVKVGAPLTDVTAGILGAMGIAAAYTHRLKTGEGQRVDTSLYEAGIVHTYWQSAIAFATGVAPGPMGSAHPLNAPYQAFETADGYINVGAANQRNWERLLAVLEHEELNDDQRFSTNEKRRTNLDALNLVLAPYFKTKTTDEWLSDFEDAGLPAGPVWSVSQMHEDEQTQFREMVVPLNHPVAGETQAIGHPVKYSKTPAKIESPAPLLGQHTVEVLREAGYGQEAIDAMIADGAAISAA